jgi:hypothetical protein
LGIPLHGHIQKASFGRSPQKSASFTSPQMKTSA